MGLINWLGRQLIDIIEWKDLTQDTLVWQYPRQDNEIKMGARLIVRESQQAVFINEGKLADVYQPGTYPLTTQNMPILSDLKGWKFGFESPFKAEIYYVSTKQFIDQRWGTKNPLIIDDPRFGMIELRAFGTFSYRITDAAKFIKEISGTDNEYTVDELNGQLRSLIVNKFSGAAGSGNIPIDRFAGSLDSVSAFCQEKLNVEFEKYGIQIPLFLIENVSMPDGLKEEIFEYSRLNKVDTQQLAAFRTAKVIDKVAENGSSIGAAGMQFGLGLGMTNMMASSLNNSLGQINGTGNNTPPANNTTPPPAGNNMPPPLPTEVEYYVAAFGKQTGPFKIDDLTSMAESGMFKRDSLVWKAGMAQWSAAIGLPELNSVFASMPPPLPPDINHS